MAPNFTAGVPNLIHKAMDSTLCNSNEVNCKCDFNSKCL